MPHLDRDPQPGRPDRRNSASVSSSSPGSPFHVGGSCSRTGPSVAPSPAAAPSSRLAGSAGSFSRRTWVRYRLALTAITNPGGVRSAHAPNVSFDGSR